MDESTFDQRNQHVGQQFNAEYQIFVGITPGADHIRGDQVTVDHHATLPQQSTVAEFYVTLGKLADLAIRFRIIAEKGDFTPNILREMSKMCHEWPAFASELRAHARRYQAMSQSQALEEKASKIALTITEALRGAANVADARATGAALKPYGVQHLKNWPTVEEFKRHVRAVNYSFLTRVIRLGAEA